MRTRNVGTECVQWLLGHANIASTRDTYSHLTLPDRTQKRPCASGPG
jgi:site-specific recombinase XerD